ncbi:MAG TPA: hypothetical protein VMY38_06535 [Gemmatimonadaceae bacterium]|nr:hypothetical protein [Gemmatimonadaceae bacterium]
MRPLAFAATLILVAASASAPEAQVAVPYRAQPRFVVFGDAIMSKPKGEFANYVDQGFGFNGGAMMRLDPAGMFGIRAEIGGLQYGRERMPITFDFSGRLSADVVTTNTIGWIAIGPQFTFPAGPIRPYANAAFAVTNFRTTSSIEDRQTSENFATTENASDFASAVVFGGGIYVPIGGRMSTAMLTLGGKYYYGGEATYLPEGGIQDNPDGSITLTPARTKTDFVIWQLGVTVGIPSRRR